MTNSEPSYPLPELRLAMEDMAHQSALYQPSAFWKEASSQILAEIYANGVESFRSLPTPLDFFVPTFGSPGNALDKQQIHQILTHFKEVFPDAEKGRLGLGAYLSGHTAALADYRNFLAADLPAKRPFLGGFSESKVGQPIEQFVFDDKAFSRSALNYLLGLCMLKKHLACGEVVRNVLEIGGGFGTLGEILAKCGVEDPHYVDLDIPPTSYVAQYYLGEVLGRENVSTYMQTRHLFEIPIDALSPAAALCAWQIEKLRGDVDLFVNFISFQEMEPEIVRNYLNQVSRLNTRWVLLRNMREGKQVMKVGTAVGVETPIFGDDYIEMLPDYELVERNVHPFGFETLDGFHSEILLLRRK